MEAAIANFNFKDAGTGAIILIFFYVFIRLSVLSYIIYHDIRQYPQGLGVEVMALE